MKLFFPTNLILTLGNMKIFYRLNILYCIYNESLKYLVKNSDYLRTLRTKNNLDDNTKLLKYGEKWLRSQSNNTNNREKSLFSSKDCQLKILSNNVRMIPLSLFGMGYNRNRNATFGLYGNSFSDSKRLGTFGTQNKYVLRKSNDPYKGTTGPVGYFSGFGEYNNTPRGVSDSGEKGLSFVFDYRSKEANLLDYNKSLIDSKIYTFIPSSNATLNINFASKTQSYHPRIKISESNPNEKPGKNSYKELSGLNKEYGNHSSKYTVKKGFKYVLEIGSDESLIHEPFDNLNSGNFIVSLSAGKKTLQETLEDCKHQVMIKGIKGLLPTDHQQTLIFAKNREDHKIESSYIIEAGVLDYSLTPLYDDINKSISLFYHFITYSNKSKTVLVNPRNRIAAIAKLICSENFEEEIYQGIEIKPNLYFFEIPCSCACDVIADLKS